MTKRLIFFLAALVLIALAAFAAEQWYTLRVAHSSFGNYYAFRGCTKLLSRTETSGTCKTADGQTITIVEYDQKWYLQGDLPWACVHGFCFGP